MPEQDSTIERNSLDTFRQVVTSRRSVRVYDGTPVPAEVMEDCLNLALLAPNSSNLQPWEFHWVRTPELKREVVAACLSQPAARTAAELVVCVARTRTWEHGSREMLAHFDREEASGKKISAGARRYYERDTRFLYEQGTFGWRGWIKRLVFFFQGIKKPVAREPVSEHDMQLWATKSSSLACENLMLALRAHGYDSCPMEGFDSRRLRKLLGLAPDAVINMVISAGRRAPHGVYGPQVRFDRARYVIEH